MSFQNAIIGLTSHKWYKPLQHSCFHLVNVHCWEVISISRCYCSDFWPQHGHSICSATFMASAMVINSYSSTLENRGTWQTKQKTHTKPLQFKTVPNQRLPESSKYGKYVQISSNITIFDLFLNHPHSHSFTGVVAPPWESLTRSLCVQLQHPDWMNLYRRGTEHQKIHTLMMLLKLSRSNSHKIPFSLQITVASRIGKFKEFCSPPVRNAKGWSWSRKWSPRKR